MTQLIIAQFGKPDEEPEILNFAKNVSQSQNNEGVIFASTQFKEQNSLLENGKLHDTEVLKHIIDDDPYQAFIESLKLLDPHTKKLDLLIVGHGQILSGDHYITTTPEGYVKKTLLIKTKDLFVKIKDALPGAKFNILLLSCFAGMAQKDVNSLNENSVLYTNSDPSSVLAVRPFRAALNKYSKDQEYTHEGFIKLMLLNRNIFTYQEKNPILKDVPILSTDLVIKGVSGEKTPPKVFEFNNLQESFDEIVNQLGELKNLYEYNQFINMVISYKVSEFAKDELYELLKNYNHVLSYLALKMNIGHDYNSDDYLPFVHAFTTKKMVVSYTEYLKIFFNIANSENSNFFGLLNPKSLNITLVKEYNSSVTNDDFLQKVQMKFLQGNDIDHFTTVRVMCDISKQHNNVVNEEHLLRLALVSNTPDYLLITSRITKQDAIDLINGNKDINKFLLGLLREDYQVNLKSLMDQLSELSDDKETIAKIRESLDAKIENSLVSQERLEKKVFSAAEGCLKSIFENHKLATFNFDSDQKMLENLAEYDHNNGSEVEILQLGGCIVDCTEL